MSGKNVAASIRQRLLNLSRVSGDDFQLVLTRYAVERLLYRLGESEHAPQFVLKGAVLFALWTGRMHRPTRDLDLLGSGDPDEGRLNEVFGSLCRTQLLDDGLVFDPDTVQVRPIREDQEYGGSRATFIARLGTARVDLQVDVGFGDVITPRAEVVEYPTLLGMDPPRLWAYPRQTVVAEKLDAMVQLGLTNSRMKDFFDLLVLARTFPFEGPLVRDAVAATFARRKTPLPGQVPVALTEAFGQDESKRKQWAAFCNRGGLTGQAGELIDVVAELEVFLWPPLAAVSESAPFPQVWRPGGPWMSPA